MLLCHDCAEAGGGGREGALYSVLTASKTPLRGLITDGGGGGLAMGLMARQGNVRGTSGVLGVGVGG